MFPPVKHYLWGGEFWPVGFCISTVGRHTRQGEFWRYIALHGRQQEHSKLHTRQFRLTETVLKTLDVSPGVKASR